LHIKVLEGLEKRKGNETSWARSMAMSLLSYLLSLQLGVMEVQAYPQLESSSWGGLNPNLTVEVDPKSAMDTRFGNQLLELGGSSGTMCEETYGFLPCSTSVGGNLVLMLGYGYLLFTAAKFISDGSELLLEVKAFPSICAFHSLRVRQLGNEVMNQHFCHNFLLLLVSLAIFKYITLGTLADVAVFRKQCN